MFLVITPFSIPFFSNKAKNLWGIAGSSSHMFVKSFRPSLYTAFGRSLKPHLVKKIGIIFDQSQLSGLLKSGMPDSVLTPVPVKATRFSELTIELATSFILSLSIYQNNSPRKVRFLVFS